MIHKFYFNEHSKYEFPLYGKFGLTQNFIVSWKRNFRNINSFGFVPFLFLINESMSDETLYFLVCIVDAKLLERIH